MNQILGRHRPGKADDMAHNVLKILTMDSVRDTLIDGGLKRAQDFSVEKYGKEMSKAFGLKI